MIKLSIIIAVYNKARYIQKTIQNAINQSFDNYEIIIVNDGSTDNSEAQILTYKDPRIRYYKQSNKGAGAARNKAISLAKYEYIALLDADDFWDPEYLQEQILLIQKFPTHKVFATAIRIEDKDGIRPSQYTFSNPENVKCLSLDYFESSLKNTLLTSSSTVIHKDVFKKTGMYDPSIKSGQDTDLWIRIGLNYPIAFNTQSYATYTYAEQSLYKSIRTVADRPDFEKYKTQEITHEGLKKFLDINRFSLAIRAISWNEPEAFFFFKERIDSNNLNNRQRFLLQLPSWILKLLFRFKKKLERFGIRLSIFG